MSRRHLAVVLAAVVVGGCANFEPGQAEKPAGGPPSSVVDASLLGSGNFPVTPTPPLGTAGVMSTGALIDARRLADDVVGPWEIDPRMVVPGQSRAVVIPGAPALGTILPAAVASTAGAHNMLYGFASDRQDLDRWRLMNGVLRFPDASAAGAAAADLAGAVARLAPTSDHPVPISGHPDAQAVTFGSNLDAGPDQPVTLYAFTPHGPYVLTQAVYAPDQDAAATAVAAALTAQMPRIDQFVPTDPAKFAALAVDPSGMLSHTMPPPTFPDPPSSRLPDAKVGSYLPRAALHFQDDPAGAAPLFEAAGLREMTYDQTILYRAKDAAAAKQLVDDLADLTGRTEVSTRPANAVDFLPGSRCVQSEIDPTLTNGSMFYCFAALNDTVIAVHNADATGARQETAAQYKMLLTP